MISFEENAAKSPSLFNLLKQQLNSHMPLVSCTKATLAHLSHTLEDMVLSRRLPAIVVTGFQESSYWRQETERYRALAQVAQQVCIFSGAPLPSDGETDSIHVTLSRDDPLRQEWFLAILSEPLAVILCGQDKQIATEAEAARQFETLWSFEPHIINMALDVLEKVVAGYRPEKLSQLQTARHNYPVVQPDLTLLTEFTLQLVRFEEGLHQRYRETEAFLRQHQNYLEAEVAQRTDELMKVHQRYRDHLEDLVIERTAELRAANQQLQREIAERQRAEAERERLLAAEQEQRLLAETMREVTLALTSQMDHTAVLDEILRQSHRLVPCSALHIMLLQDNMLRMARWQGYEAFGCAEFMANLIQPVSNLKMSMMVIQTRTALVIPDISQEPNWTVIPETSWIQAHLTMPICLQERVLGLLRLDGDTPGQFSEKDAQRLQALSGVAAIALENARLYTETQRQARQMEQVLNSVEAGLLLLDAEYQIKMANPAGRIYLSMLANTQFGQPLTHLGDTPLEDLLTLPRNTHYHEVTPHGADRPIFEVTARPVTGAPKTEGWVLVVRDVTAERDTQKGLQQQEKLAVVGQLAAGIAHDFNNILTSIIGFAQLGLITPAVPDSLQRDLNQIVKQGQRAAHLVRQILDFARQNISAKRILEFSQFLDDMMKLLERTIPETIRLELEIEHNGECNINADPTQLQQVLTNLAVNAADAMPMGGVLRFRLSNFTLVSGQRPPYPGMPPGNWLALAISDTGTGIPPEAQTHIFEPFFTTKEVGQGTGLGLAQVDGIIKQHNGYINMHSQVGQGTTFTIFLPALHSSKPGSPKMAQEQISQEQGQTILLVEDNLAVLTVVSAMLERLGYQVLTAANGREALELCYQHQAEIRLVITDLAMPEMDGLTLARILQTSHLHPKILAITGYPLKMTQSDLSALGIIDWLQKPINLELLAYKLEQVLSKKS